MGVAGSRFVPMIFPLVLLLVGIPLRANLSPEQAETNIVTAYVVLEGAGAATSWKAESRQGGIRALDVSRQRLAAIAASQEALRPSLRRLGARETGSLTKLANAVRVQVPAGQLAKLGSLPNVTKVYKTRRYYRATATSVPHSGAAWVWTNMPGGIDGTGVRVGIIDSGIDYTHAAFGGPGTREAFLNNNPTVIEPGTFPTPKVAGGFDFVGDDYDPASLIHGSPRPDPDPLDAGSGHGTSVAGIVGGFGILTNGLTYPGPYTNALNPDAFLLGPGMAPGVTLYALKVFGRAGSTDVLAEALEWAADPNNDGDFSDRLDVVNLSVVSSFGFGSSDDLDVVLAENLAQLGCVVVGAAGNGGDTFYIGGGPASAPSAISVANLNDFGDAIEIESPAEIAGIHSVSTADFGPTMHDAGPIVGPVVYVNPPEGCGPLTNASAVAGKIALIDRGNCRFVEKVLTAQQAGAVAVIIVNNAPGPPIPMEGDNPDVTNIPVVMVSRATGSLIKNALLSGDVVVRLDASLGNPNDTLHDTVVPSSSRGPVAPFNLLKPEIAAPGQDVLTPRIGTGRQAIPFSGTSSSSPHVAGAAALLKQMHPHWPVQDIKAALLNGAVALFETNGIAHPESRVGAGRLRVDQSAATQVVAAAEEHDGRVAVSFGALEFVTPRNVTRRVQLRNHGTEPVEFEVALSNSVTQTGVSLSTDTTTIIVPPLGSTNVALNLFADPALLQPRLDPLTPTTIGDEPRAGLFEASGQVWFLNATNSIHVPYYAIIRPAARRQSPGIVLWPIESVSTIPLSGPSGHRQPLVSAFQLGFLTNSLVRNSLSDQPADLLAVGAACDISSKGDFSASTLFFGLATAQPWTTPHFANVGFRIEIDWDFDQVPNATLFNSSLGNIVAENLTSGDAALDAFLTAVRGTTNIRQGLPLNYFKPDVRDTALFNTRVLVQAASVAAIGIPPTQTRFAYRVRTSGNGTVSLATVKETPWITFDAAQPGIDTAYGIDGTPFYGGETITAKMNDATLDAFPQSRAVLLLHHMNTVASQMEVVRFAPNVSLQITGSQIVLQWPQPGPFLVEMTGSLKPPITWIEAGTVSRRFETSLGEGSGRFFRITSR